ncbi:hypothetical protein SFRURICE_009233 [Spodoptera frugiperda]|nr:hypothetical protein SFRURICE_009233 [Spodoptera frugiperda]
MDDVTNILHRTYEVSMRINTDRKSQRTTVGQKARQACIRAHSEASQRCPHHATTQRAQECDGCASTMLSLDHISVTELFGSN